MLSDNRKVHDPSRPCPFRSIKKGRRFSRPHDKIFPSAAAEAAAVNEVNQPGPLQRAGG
jgi:hypothetical protein